MWVSFHVTKSRTTPSRLRSVQSQDADADSASSILRGLDSLGGRGITNQGPRRAAGT